MPKGLVPKDRHMRLALAWGAIVWLFMVLYIPLFYEERETADWGYLLSPAFLIVTVIIVAGVPLVAWAERREAAKKAKKQDDEGERSG